MSELKVGDQAPEFTAKLSNGNDFSLKELKGKRNLVLYFYPKDFTSGCTKEACYFRDYNKEFDAVETDIIGVSRDNESSHQKFSDKHGLEFPLISDPDTRIAKLYNVVRLGGKMGVKRVTFVISKEGVIINIIQSETNMLTHVESSLQAIKEVS